MTAEPLGPPTGVDERVLRQFASRRGEPDWLVNLRLDALRSLPELLSPSWRESEVAGAAGRTELPAGPSRRWGTGTTPGVASIVTEQTAGMAAQADAELVFQRQLETLHRDGVVFCDLGTAVIEHANLVQPYLGTLLRNSRDRIEALTEALWSGGTFLYVPAGVTVELPLQSYARIRSESPDRFERTLMVVDEGASVHYLEGCASPVYSTDQLRGAVVEIVAGPSARAAYTTVQNWSANVTEVTRTAAEVHAGGRLEWTAGNIGARRSVRRLTCRLSGDGATAVAQTVSYAGLDQAKNIGIRMAHAAAGTRSEILSRSVADTRGRVDHHDLVVSEGEPTGCESVVRVDGLTLGEGASVACSAADDGHRADRASDDRTSLGFEPAVRTTAALDEGKLFYLMSRGLSRQQATALLVNGFISPVINTLPTEYAVEWNRLIELQIEGAIG